MSSAGRAYKHILTNAMAAEIMTSNEQRKLAEKANPNRFLVF